MSGAVAVTVYVREGCHLCEIALAVLGRLGAGRLFALEVVDIERDDALHRRYLERIPVVAVNGEELCDFEVDEAAVLAALADGPSSMGAA